MIVSLLVALIYIAIICAIGFGVLAVLGAVGIQLPPIVVIVFKVLIAVFCLLVLLQIVTGSGGMNLPYLRRP